MSRALRPILAAALFATCACKEVDDTVVVDIGALRPSMADSGLGTQAVSLDAADYRIQAVEWVVAPKPAGTSATDGLHLDLGGVGINLTCVDPSGECAGEECRFLDTAVASPRASGRCASGVIVDGVRTEAEGQPARLDVVLVSITLYRLAPLALAPGQDHDGDTVPDERDNCPLVPNRDQRDTGAKGFGDACSAFEPFTGRFLLDSDADLIPDLRDNCPDVANSDQADAGKPFGSLSIPDGIGDACDDREQIATVDGLDPNPEPPYQPTFIKTLSSLAPALRANTFLTLDYDGAFDCNWSLGTCTLSQGAVTLCRDLQGGIGCS